MAAPTTAAPADLKAWVDIAMPVLTGAMACLTGWLAYETRKLEKGWRDTSTEQINNFRKISSEQVDAWFKSSREEIGVQTWMFMEERFDSRNMLRSRKLLAEQLEAYDSSKHEAITGEVLELFESISALYNRGLLDKELAYCSFSYYTVYWWEASRLFIEKERKDCRDETLYEEFEKFAQQMREREKISRIDPADLKNFLLDEKDLRVVFPS